mmetsp:Transcript_14018/g.21129  ORF Transcript_14018/g.21129 Transcript_14018/m.21129 type:complete len:225 (-) Transcript_14018:572-1246(-)
MPLCSTISRRAIPIPKLLRWPNIGSSLIAATILRCKSNKSIIDMRWRCVRGRSRSSSICLRGCKQWMRRIANATLFVRIGFCAISSAPVCWANGRKCARLARNWSVWSPRVWPPMDSSKRRCIRCICLSILRSSCRISLRTSRKSITMWSDMRRALIRCCVRHCASRSGILSIAPRCSRLGLARHRKPIMTCSNNSRWARTTTATVMVISSESTPKCRHRLARA